MGKVATLSILTCLCLALISAKASEDPNDIIRNALKNGLGVNLIPKGMLYKVQDWHGVSSSSSFPGGSVSGSAYTGKISGAAVGAGHPGILFVVFSSLLALLLTNF